MMFTIYYYYKRKLENSIRTVPVPCAPRKRYVRFILFFSYIPPSPSPSSFPTRDFRWYNRAGSRGRPTRFFGTGVSTHRRRLLSADDNPVFENENARAPRDLYRDDDHPSRKGRQKKKPRIRAHKTIRGDERARTRV